MAFYFDKAFYGRGLDLAYIVRLTRENPGRHERARQRLLDHIFCLVDDVAAYERPNGAFTTDPNHATTAWLGELNSR